MALAAARRSWSLAGLALLAGTLLWCWDELSQWLLPAGHWALHLADIGELALMGPGLACAAFLASELLARRVSEERQHRLASLGVVAASVAHEVRNPVHNLRLLLDEAAAEGALPADGDLHRRLVANAERIRQAVDLVYCLARPESQAAAAGPCDLRPVLAAAGLAVPDPEHPPLVAVEPLLVQLVLGNLVRNARAAPGGTAAPSARLVGEAGAWVVELANPGSLPHGAGQAPLDSAKPDGLGLGLYLSRQLAESAGGALSVEERDGQVVARLRLPRAAP